MRWEIVILWFPWICKKCIENKMFCSHQVGSPHSVYLFIRLYICRVLSAQRSRIDKDYLPIEFDSICFSLEAVPVSILYFSFTKCCSYLLQIHYGVTRTRCVTRMKKRLTITVCDIDELEKLEQKTENVTQINVRHNIGKCTLYTYADEGSLQSAKERHEIIMCIKKELEGIEISRGNEIEASPEHSSQHRKLILDSSIDRRWFSVFALKEETKFTWDQIMHVRHKESNSKSESIQFSFQWSCLYQWLCKMFNVHRIYVRCKRTKIRIRTIICSLFSASMG